MRTDGNTAAPRAAHSQALDLLRFPLAVVVLTVYAFGIQGVQVYGEYHDFMSMPASLISLSAVFTTISFTNLNSLTSEVSGIMM